MKGKALLTVKCVHCGAGQVDEVEVGKWQCHFCDSMYMDLNLLIAARASKYPNQNFILPIPESDLPPMVYAGQLVDMKIVDQERKLVDAGWDKFLARVKEDGYSEQKLRVFLWTLSVNLRLSLYRDWTPEDVKEALKQQHLVTSLRREMLSYQIEGNIVLKYMTQFDSTQEAVDEAHALFLMFGLAIGSHRVVSTTS